MVKFVISKQPPCLFMVVKPNGNLSSQVQFHDDESSICWIMADPIITVFLLMTHLTYVNAIEPFPFLKQNEQCNYPAALGSVNLQQNSTLSYAEQLYKMCCFITTILWLALTKQSVHSWGHSGPAQRSPVTLSFSSTNSRKCSISYVTVAKINYSECNNSGLFLSQYA